MGLIDDVSNGLDSVLDDLDPGTACASLAVIGVVTTGFLAARAAARSVKIKDKTLSDYIRTYSAPVLSGLATIGLIVASDRIHVSHAIELGAVASMWKANYADLEAKVSDKLGVEEVDKIKEEIISERAAQTPVPQVPVSISNDNLILFEPYTKQYLVTSKAQLAWAFLDLNEQICGEGSADLNFIIDKLGGKEDPVGSRYGWSDELSVQISQNAFFGVPYVRPVTDSELSNFTTVNGEKIYKLRYLPEPEELPA